MNISSILPQIIDNNYKGHKIALYTFYLLLIITIVRSLIHIFAPDGGAESIASIPLDDYSLGAQSAIILMFSLWGSSQLMIAIFYFIVAIRYKSLISLMYCFLILEYVMRLLVGFAKPMDVLHTPPGAYANYIFPIVSIIMLYFSMPPSKEIS